MPRGIIWMECLPRLSFGLCKWTRVHRLRAGIESCISQQTDYPAKNKIVVPSVGTLPVTKNDNLGLTYYGGFEYFPREDITLGTYYSEYYPNRKDKSSSSRQFQTDLALTLRYDINEWLLAKLEGHKIHGSGQASSILNPRGFDRDWYLWLAKISASF